MYDKKKYLERKKHTVDYTRDHSQRYIQNRIQDSYGLPHFLNRPVVTLLIKLEAKKNTQPNKR